MKIYKRPEFYDIFGMLAFIYIIALSLFQINSNAVLSHQWYILMLIIGIIGLVVDVTVVYNKFLK